METTLFLQSEFDNPYEIYMLMLEHNPVFWDDRNKLRAVYFYDCCVELLKNPSAVIPCIDKEKLNDYATCIANNLVRLSNPPQHATAKEITMHLFENMKPVPIPELLSGLLTNVENLVQIDWVNTVCKKLPVLSMLKAFEFTDADIEFIQRRMERITKIMLPDKTDEQVDMSNEVSKDLYPLVESHIINRGFLKTIIDSAKQIDKEESLQLYVSNFIGLLIQSYDAGRGILSNSLLQVLVNSSKNKINKNDENYFYKSVVESLRFDPPIHNTKRILNKDVFICNHCMRKGEAVLIVVAAANHDVQKFNKPNEYDVYRNNNDEHITFGAGHHACVAKHFSTKITSDALMYLFNRYQKIELCEKQVAHEPLINARLPKQLFISLKN